jgi:hypothetical protein
MCPRGQIITARVLIPCVIILTYPWESVGSAVHFKGFSLLFSLMKNRRNEIIIKKRSPAGWAAQGLVAEQPTSRLVARHASAWERQPSLPAEKPEQA